MHTQPYWYDTKQAIDRFRRETAQISPTSDSHTNHILSYATHFIFMVGVVSMAAAVCFLMWGV